MKPVAKYLLICALLPFHGMLAAQGDAGNPDFPKGSPILRIFANVYTGLTDADPSKAFEIRRAYIGYKYQFDPHFSTELKLDIGSPNDISEFSRIRRYAYFKTAALYWDKGKWTLKGGIIDTEHFGIQEKYWKHRYIYKSMQDEHSFGPKADLGTTVVYRVHQQISLDASLMNGEGYSNLQRDNNFKASMGVSLYPLERILLRIYYDFINQEVLQSTLSTFAGYSYKRITAGAEYNRKGNADFNGNHNQTGLSAYLSCDLNDKFEVFGRFDRLSSYIPEEYTKPWNLQDDGSALIAGIQFQPIKHVKIAMDYQDWVPYAANLGNQRYLFINLEFVL
jgi:hypothetical protein